MKNGLLLTAALALPLGSALADPAPGPVYDSHPNEIAVPFPREAKGTFRLGETHVMPPGLDASGPPTLTLELPRNGDQIATAAISAFDAHQARLAQRILDRALEHWLHDDGEGLATAEKPASKSNSIAP